MQRHRHAGEKATGRLREIGMILLQTKESRLPEARGEEGFFLRFLGPSSFRVCMALPTLILDFSLSELRE